MQNSIQDVTIIGGGVIGCAIARELSRYHLKVTLLERHAECGFGTTKTNSGIIHPGHDTPLSTLKGRLVVRGNQMFDQLQKELKFGFERIGAIYWIREQEDRPRLEALLRLGQEKGVPGLEIWDSDRLEREEPNLSRELIAALYAPSGGVINPYEFAFALIECAQNNGVTLKIDSPVLSIDREDVGDGGLLHVHTPMETVVTRYVVNAAGVYADRVAAMVGLDDFSINPRKGEEFMLDKRLQGIVRRLVFPLPTGVTKGTLIIPTYDGTIMVGPTAHDTGDREDVTTTTDGAAEIFSYVNKLCPSIHPSDAITAFAGLRAVSSTGDFIIGPTSVKGFINAAGIQSPGLTSAPSIGEYVVGILESEGLAMSLKDDFRAEIDGSPRFAKQPVEVQERMVASDPAFGKIVCRCEIVTEAEIHDAIDHGARTVDGVKFRCRAGMGRCQGGFCTSRIITILSERLGIPPEQVTKRGGGSWIMTPMNDPVVAVVAEVEV
ncbi:MAG TPA: NAD(P)/FAD-dependent oxidoreductase [Myxococcota bacterium]|nr:NAD(P)/FAD-dependent oxidoreductase [Myxococcota bacterium]